MLKIQVPQTSSEPKKHKNIWAKETCELKELWLWLPNVNALIWEGVCVFVWNQNNYVSEFNYITLKCHSENQDGHWGKVRKTHWELYTTQICQLMLHQFNSSKGFLCGQFAISIPIKGYSLSEDHIPDVLQSYSSLLSVLPGVCSAGTGTILLSVSASLLSVSAAGKGFKYAVNVRLHTQHLLHQERDRKAKPFFQMSSEVLTKLFLKYSDFF